MKSFLFVGAGLSNLVLARELVESDLDLKCHIIDQRHHIGGNCYTEIDSKTGVNIHKYGPHIFNTSNKEVIKYLKKFTKLIQFKHSVKALIPGKGIYQLPINLHTINQFYNLQMSPDEAFEFIRKQSNKDILAPTNFEEQALKFIGKELYESFFYGYTLKQWGCYPCELPASILKRIPIRFNYNDSYYNTSYTAMPKNGYTEIFEKIIDHPNIEVELNQSYDQSMNKYFNHIFYSGRLDEFFNFNFGRLGYRTVYWDNEVFDGDFQGNSVINYPSLEQEFTRIIEHKHFSPWENHKKTFISREYSKETADGDIPYYPKRIKDDINTLKEYINQIDMLNLNITFLGRLGTYRYLDMHQVIDESLKFSKRFLKLTYLNENIPKFSVDRLI
tara:strand:- start:4346 stop:5509 length:1164 start_codon:yes stop_codon:yes gene_type:complete